jgi:hypothetical protein
MSHLPEKREDLVALGYEYLGDGRCSKCQEVIEWWQTPKGKRTPMRVFEERDSIGKTGFFRRSHFADCPFADSFRKAKYGTKKNIANQ